MELVYETLALPGDPGLTLYINAAEPATPSADALRLLAAWSTPMQEPTPHQQKEHQD
ncbi:hypothetical protein [Actinoplanes sp. NPDC048796]